MKLSKLAPFLLVLSPLAGCVSLEFPGIVSDTVRVGKDAYRKVTGQKDEEGKDGKEAKDSKDGKSESAAGGGQYFSHSYVGRSTQTVVEVRQACIDEAVDRLQKSMRKDMPYSVADVTITTVDNLPVATCKLALGKAPAGADEKK